jgi:hypothetical protein
VKRRVRCLQRTFVKAAGAALAPVLWSVDAHVPSRTALALLGFNLIIFYFNLLLFFQ